MTPAAALDMHRRQLGAHGEDVIVRRFTGPGDPRPKTDVTTRARVMGYEPSQLIGSIVQGDRKVIALIDALSGLLPLTTADKLVIRDRECAIKAIDDNTRRIDGVLIALELQVTA